MNAPLRICVPLGALLPGTLDLLERSGLDVGVVRNPGRKLALEAPDGTVFITTRPSDVPTYVEAGAADIGISGRDVLVERVPDVYELLDLGYGECRMSYCTRAGEDPTPGALDRLGVVRVATKYPRSAAQHFARVGRQVELVKVNGSVELAALVGLAHGIVDLVATGTTLCENGLVEREVIFESSARLIANRASYTLRAERIGAVLDAMRAVVKEGVRE